MPVQFSQTMVNSIKHYGNPATASILVPEIVPNSNRPLNILGNPVIGIFEVSDFLKRPHTHSELFTEVNTAISDLEMYLAKLENESHSIEQELLLQTAKTDLLPKVKANVSLHLTPYELIQSFILVKSAQLIIEDPSDMQNQQQLARLLNKMEGKRDPENMKLAAALMAFTTFCIVAAIACIAVATAAALTGGGLMLTVAMIAFSILIIPPLRELLHRMVHKKDYNYQPTPFVHGCLIISDDKKHAKHSYFPEGILAAQGFYAKAKELKNPNVIAEARQQLLKNSR